MLELHIWGPIGQLPSLDAECIAAVAYLASTLSTEDWRIVPGSDPSICPARLLPALFDSSNNSWTSGYPSIVSHLTGSASPSHRRHLDSALSAPQRGEVTAYGSLLASVAQPIVDASMYASEDNWADVTRPAFGRLLPFPTSWMLPHALRTSALERAGRLQLSRLLDLLEQPDRLDGGDDDDDQGGAAAAAAGPLTVTQSLASKLRSSNKDTVATRVTKKVVQEKLVAEVTMLLMPLSEKLQESNVTTAADSDGRAPTFFGGGVVSSLDCLAFGYLLLMTELEMPQAFAKRAVDALPFVPEFIEGMNASLRLASLQLAKPDTSLGRKMFRSVDHIIRGITLVGDEYAAEMVRRSASRTSLLSRHGAALVGGALLTGLALGGSYRVWRASQPFGVAVHTFTQATAGMPLRFDGIRMIGSFAGAVLACQSQAREAARSLYLRLIGIVL